MNTISVKNLNTYAVLNVGTLYKVFIEHLQCKFVLSKY